MARIPVTHEGNVILSKDGCTLTPQHHPGTLVASHNEAATTAGHELIAAPAAGLRIVVTRIMVSNGATAGDLTFQEDTTGTPVQKGPKHYLAINGGFAYEVYWPLTAAKNCGWATNTVTTHSVAVEYHLEATS